MTYLKFIELFVLVLYGELMSRKDKITKIDFYIIWFLLLFKTILYLNL